MHLRSRLLGLLSDGKLHSGAALGNALGVSRMAVCKHLRALREAGVALEVVRSKGYRLSGPCELLDRTAILDGLRPETRATLGCLEIHQELDSTSNHLRARAQEGAVHGSVCIAEMQHAGRGRHGRCWVSPFGSNLYLSLLWRTELGVSALGGMSLATGVGVMQSLHQLGVPHARLKWPNDVLVNDAKLAGILIDVTGESTGPSSAVIGVGINVRMPVQAAASIDQPWTDLASQPGIGALSRNRLASVLLDHLVAMLRAFDNSGLACCLADWQHNDALQGRPVELNVAGRPVTGIARGIDDTGALLLEGDDGQFQRFLAGDIRVRRQ